MNTPKVALCLSGQPRWFSVAGSHFIKSILSKFDCDVFFHTWFDNNRIGEPYSGSSWNRNTTDHYRRDTVVDLYNLYNPVSFIVQPEYNVFPTPRKIEEYQQKNTLPHLGPVNNCFSMFYSICKSLQLAFEHESNNNFKYDCVIRSRFDCAIEYDSFNFHNLEKNTVYFTDCIRNPDVIADYFNYGTSDSMKIYSKIYDNIDPYWNEDNVLVCGEEMLTHHLREKNKFKTVAVPATTHLIRDELFTNKTFGKTYGD
tara:strand:+ start:151 stop:918 length:768 start_codon:yes stop_codon:yes gene_type:complete